MPRVVTSAMLAALQSANPRLVLLFSLAFHSETAYLWTGSSPVTWSGHTWLGAARVLSLSRIEEGAGLSAGGITMGVSGIDADLLPEVLSDYRLGGAVKVWLGALDGSGALIADPVPAWSGRLDKPYVRVTGKTATIEINCATRLLDMNVAVDSRRTHDDQQQRVPGDLAFVFVNGIQELTISFGQSTLNTRNI